MADCYVFKVQFAGKKVKRRRWAFSGDPTSRQLFDGLFVRSAEASGLSAVSRLRLSLWNWQTQRPVFLSRDYQQFLTQEAQECFTSAPRDKKHRRFIAVTVNSGYEPAYLTSALPGSFPECHSSNSSIHPESPPAKSEALPSHAQDDEDNDLFGKPFGDHDRDVLMKLQTEIQEIKRNQQEQLNRSEQPCATCTTRSAQQKTSKVPKHDWLQRLHAHLQDNLGIDLSNLDLGRPSPPMSSSSAALPVRHAASCDVCSGPIIGTRIRCMECPDWDCCSDCEPSLGQLHPHHKFIPIYENNGPWQPQNLVRHRGITCDGCKEFIAGPRFKCIVCPDYDLCMRCEALPIPVHHPEHFLLKLPQPPADPSKLYQALDAARDVLNAPGSSSSSSSSSSSKKTPFAQAPVASPFTSTASREIDPLACLVDLDLQLPHETASTVTVHLDHEGRVATHEVTARPSQTCPSPGVALQEPGLCVSVASLPATITVLLDACGRVEGSFAESSTQPLPRPKAIDEEAEAAAELLKAQQQTNTTPSIQDVNVGLITFPSSVHVKLGESGQVLDASAAILEGQPQSTPRPLGSVIAELDVCLERKDLPGSLRIDFDQEGQIISQQVMSSTFEMVDKQQRAVAIPPCNDVSLDRPVDDPNHTPEEIQPKEESAPRPNTSEKPLPFVAEDLPLAQFVEDVTIEDKSVMPPSALFTKTWKVRNVGPQPWPAGTKLVHVGGNFRPSEDDSLIALEAESGQETEVSVECKAPDQPGQYMSFWRLASGTDGKSFGDRLWIEIHVREDVNSASSSQSLASSMVRMPQARSTAATAHSAKTSTQSSTHPDRRSSSTAITVSAASSEADDDLSVISAEDDFVILSDDQETTSSLSNQDHHVSANSWVQNH